MKKFDLARAWKDSAYFAKLDTQQQSLARNPAGVAELDAALLDSVAAAGTSNSACSNSASGFTTWCHACRE